MGNKLGKAKRVNQTTELVLRGHFAFTKVDLMKLLIPYVRFMGHVRQGEYDGF